MQGGVCCVAQTCRAWVGEADTSRGLGGCGVTCVCATGRNYEPWRVGEQLDFELECFGEWDFGWVFSGFIGLFFFLPAIYRA
jgi:hypothetical protein